MVSVAISVTGPLNTNEKSQRQVVALDHERQYNVPEEG